MTVNKKQKSAFDCIDICAIESLKCLQEEGKPNIIGEFIEMFFKNLDERTEEIKKAVLQKDNKKIQFLTHSLKGSSAVLGAVHLANMLAKIEKKAKNNALDKVEEDWIELEKELIKARSCLEDIKKMFA